MRPAFKTGSIYSLKIYSELTSLNELLNLRLIRNDVDIIYLI